MSDLLEMGFFGEYSHALDEKGRIIIPAKLREGLGETFYISRGYDNCLAVFTKEKLQEILDRIQKKGEPSVTARDMRRRITSSVSVSTPNKGGRVAIPLKLRESVGIKKEVVSVGMGDFIEIWAKEEWDKYLAEHDDDIVDFE